MIVLDPLTINAPPAAPQTVEVGNTAIFRPSKIRLANESPYLLKVQIGGDTHWLSAWTADVFSANGQSNLTVSAQLIGQSTNAPSSTLLIAIAGEGEDFPGTYPIGLDRMTSIATGTVQLTASSVTINGNVPVTNPAGQQLSVQQPRKKLGTLSLANQASNNGNFTPDAGALHLVLLLPSSAPQTTVNVVGTTTGIDYLAAINGGLAFQVSKGPFRLPVPIDPEIDATYTITVTTGNPITMTVQVSQSLIGDAVDVVDGSPLSVSAAVTSLPAVNVAYLAGSPIQAVAGMQSVQTVSSNWQRPTASSPIALTIGAASAADLVVGTANKNVIMHTFALWTDDASGFLGYLRDTTPTLIMAMHVQAAGIVCSPFDFKGLQLGGGLGLQLFNQDAVAHTVRGVMTYVVQ